MLTEAMAAAISSSLTVVERVSGVGSDAALIELLKVCRSIKKVGAVIEARNFTGALPKNTAVLAAATRRWRRQELASTACRHAFRDVPVTTKRLYPLST